MLLQDVVQKTEDIISTLITSLDEEGVDGFFNDPDAIKKHLKIEEKDIQELNDESVFYCKHKDWEHAIAALSWLTFFEPVNSDHFLRLGSVLLLAKEYDAAIKVLGNGFYLDSKNPTFALYIGQCLQSLGSKDAAKEVFQECIDLSQNNSDYKHIFNLASEALHT